MSRTPTATNAIVIMSAKLNCPREESRITKTERITVKTPTIPISPRTQTVGALQSLRLRFPQFRQQVVQRRREGLGSRLRVVDRLLRRFREPGRLFLLPRLSPG